MACKPCPAAFKTKDDMRMALIAFAEERLSYDLDGRLALADSVTDSCWDIGIRRISPADMPGLFKAAADDYYSDDED